MSTTTALHAYSATGAAWQHGPGRIYDRLANTIVAASPVDLRGGLVLDLGAGTGAASRAIAAAGATPVAVDAAIGMLHAIEPPSTARAAADARTLPFRDAAFRSVVAAFSLNHLADPGPALREAVRVTARGGVVLVSAYASDDSHPIKAAVDAAAGELGWTPPPWLQELRDTITPVLATVERARDMASAAGINHAEVQRCEVELADLGVDDLIAWRCGMAQLAPFVAALTTDDRDRLRRRASELVGDAPPLVRRMVLMSVRV